MAEYQPLQSSSQSMATSIIESHDSHESSDDDLVEVESFSSFRAYTPREIEKLFVTFNATQQSYSLNEDITVHFYAVTSSFQMKPEDKIGICPMRKSIPFISKCISECAVEPDPKAVTDEIFDESEIVAKIAVFKINELPPELSNEFYFQFCYISSNNEVVGVSTPFRFQKEDSKEANALNFSTSHISEVSAQIENMGENYDSMVMEKRDDDDFIVVRSQESFLKERIEHLNKSNTLLEYLIRSLEKDLCNKNIELQKISTKLDVEKSNVIKVEEEKSHIVAEFEDVNRKHMQLQSALSEVKQLVEKERACNMQLQVELDNSKEKIVKLEETFQSTQIGEVELKNILKDKEEEIAMHKDMIANLQQINEELNKKVGISEDKTLNVQSALANALNQLRIVSDEKEKLGDYEKLVLENKALRQRVCDLEIIKENQSKEIKTLEDELRTSVSNLNNLDAKLQAERNANIKKEQTSVLSLDKAKLELIEMHARLEQSRVEYANLYRKCRALQKDRSKNEKANSSMSRSQSIASTSGTLSGISSIASAKALLEKADDIDIQLQQLDKEETQAQPTVVVKSSLSNVTPKVTRNDSLLIDIESEQHHNDSLQASAPEVQPDEGHTNVKSIATVGATATTTAVNKDTKATVSIPCIMCDQVIECHQHEDGSGQMHEMVNHLELVHKQKMCPVCSTLFDTRLPIFSNYFANHIQNHFNNIRYPSLNSNNN